MAGNDLAYSIGCRKTVPERGPCLSTAERRSWRAHHERIVGSNRWQSAHVDLTAQGINDPQHVFPSQGGLARFKVDHETHTHPCGQRQLGLCQSGLFASSTQGIAEWLR